MKKTLKLFLIIIVIVALLTIIINSYVVITTKRFILNKNKISKDNIECIVVLGASIRNGKPSPMLEDRLKMAIKLYKNGIAPKILVTGDHEYNDYDEVNTMKNYLKEHGIPSEDIFMDHAGLSTYDSIYRASKVFKTNRFVIVTQKYHLYRAIYIAKALNIDAYGVSATKRRYIGQTQRDIREAAARVKDFIKCIVRPSPTYLGEVTSIKGNGDITNDNNE